MCGSQWVVLFGKVGIASLEEEHHWGVGFEIKSFMPLQFALLHAGCSRCELSVSCSMAAMPPHCYGLYPGSQAKLNSFSHKLRLIMVFYHSNRKIIQSTYTCRHLYILQK